MSKVRKLLNQQRSEWIRMSKNSKRRKAVDVVIDLVGIIITALAAS